MKKVWKVIKGVTVFIAGGAALAGGTAYKLFSDTLKRGHRPPVSAVPEGGENPFRIIHEEGRKWAIDHKDICQRVEIKNDDVSLTGYYYDNQSDKTVILVHGLTANYLDRLYSAPLYMESGYNVLSVDCRGHGESDGAYRTMGYWDSQDVICWADYLIAEKQQEHIILDGVSMGGATVLAASGDEKLPPEVRGIVSDCAYTSIHDIFEYQMGNILKLPVVPLLNLIELYCIKLAHISMIARSPLDSVKRVKVPVLLIHGTEDHFVPYKMAQELRKACGSSHRLFSVKGAGHGDSCLVDLEGYEKVIKDFVNTL